MTSPSKAIDPAIASTTRSAGAAAKLRWVNSRYQIHKNARATPAACIEPPSLVAVPRYEIAV
jgi:hypothetical protein